MNQDVILSLPEFFTLAQTKKVLFMLWMNFQKEMHIMNGPGLIPPALWTFRLFMWCPINMGDY
jgi:hypothetical protein